MTDGIKTSAAAARADLTGRLAAIDRARSAFETIGRLAVIQREHGSLTPAQRDDHRDAVVHFNDEARLLGLTEIRSDQDWTDDDLDKAVGTLYRRESYYRAHLRTVDAFENGVGRQHMDPASGAATGRSTDAIRDMIQSHERRADFDIVHAHEEIRAIADFSDAGALYTDDFATKFAMYQRTESPWFNVATIVRADNGRPMVVPGLTADPTVYTPGEGTAITESTPTFGTATATPVSYKWLGYVSFEAIEDVEYPLADRIAQAAARSISLAFGSAATADVLAGIANGGTASGLGGGGTATFVGLEDLLDLEYGRAAPYRQSGSWIMANGMILKARKYTDKNGQYLWQNAVAQGQPDTFDGRPVYEDPYLATPASATKSALFGDWGRGLVIKATNLRVATSTDYRFANDQVSLKAVLRADVAVVDGVAAAYIVSKAT